METLHKAHIDLKDVESFIKSVDDLKQSSRDISHMEMSRETERSLHLAKDRDGAYIWSIGITTGTKSVRGIALKINNEIDGIDLVFG